MTPTEAIIALSIESKRRKKLGIVGISGPGEPSSIRKPSQRCNRLMSLSKSSVSA